MLRSEQRDVGLDVGVGFVALQEFLHPRPRVPKQRRVDELDGGGRPLDVQQDGAQRDSGMYVGPKQTGWYPWSTPLFV